MFGMFFLTINPFYVYIGKMYYITLLNAPYNKKICMSNSFVRYINMLFAHFLTFINDYQKLLILLYFTSIIINFVHLMCFILKLFICWNLFVY